MWLIWESICLCTGSFLGCLPSITQSWAGDTHLESQHYRRGNRLKDGDLKVQELN